MDDAVSPPSYAVTMSLELPTSLSPSKVSAFKECALAFRFATIDRLPEPPSEPATKGTLVHAALERLFCLPAPDRTPAAAERCLEQATAVLRADPDFVGLELDDEREAAFLADAGVLLRNYFELEDPRAVNPIGLELKLSVEVCDLTLRCIIDRLELDAEGGLVVTDYKTGRAPSERYEQSRLGGVHFYALLCERLFGQRPVRVQLLHLREPMAILTVPSAQSTRGLETRVAAIWSAVERACAQDDFRPKPGPLCHWCAFQAHCPAFGGDPSAVRPAPEPLALVP
ncbi:RecB family exonuclease [soil metagenome]